MEPKKYNPGILRAAAPLKEGVLSDHPREEWPFIFIVGERLYRRGKEKGEP